jgi:NAD(P)-dependent dehydrogenase (short-subunit alcohol dehydrogenase family)
VILRGKTVIVAGVGSGLGSEVARLCVRDGANVVLAARTEAQLEAVAKELDPTGARAAWSRTDIASADDCQRLVAVAEERFGGADALVQVAAYERVFGGLLETDFDSWRRAFDTNVLGSLQLLRAAVPGMKVRGGGAIVLIGSQSMFLPLMPQMGYAASKGALLSSMYYLAKELGPDRIRVNMVVPSWMWGPPVQGYVSYQAKKRGVPEREVLDGITRGLPLREIAADEDVAEAVVFLASDRARMITGQSLLVNAGEWMR